MKRMNLLRCLPTALALALAPGLQAQDMHSGDILPTDSATTGTTVAAPVETNVAPDDSVAATGSSSRFDDGLTVPLYAPIAPQPLLRDDFYSCVPTTFGAGWDTWQLHRGFNAQLSLSAIAGFGSGAPRGVGFGQDAAFMYALPLTGRLSLAGGVYMSNLNWGGQTWRQVGIAGVAAYQLNEKVSLYAYGSKTLFPSRVPTYWAPYLGGDRFGGMVNVKFNDTFSMRFSVERRTVSVPTYDTPDFP